MKSPEEFIKYYLDKKGYTQANIITPEKWIRIYVDYLDECKPVNNSINQDIDLRHQSINLLQNLSNLCGAEFKDKEDEEMAFKLFEEYAKQMQKISEFNNEFTNQHKYLIRTLKHQFTNLPTLSEFLDWSENININNKQLIKNYNNILKKLLILGC